MARILEGEFGPVENCDATPQFEGSEATLPKLSYQFWPRTNHGTGYKSELSSIDEEPMEEHNEDMRNLQKEHAEEMRVRQQSYVGRRSEKEREAWNPLEMIKEGTFVCLNPQAEWEKDNGKGRFWVVKSFGTVQPDQVIDGERCVGFYAEWWRPKNQKANIDDKARYANIFINTTLWERDPGFDAPKWHKASSSMYSWVFTGKPENIPKNGLKIGKKALKIVKEYIDRLEDEEARKALSVGGST